MKAMMRGTVVGFLLLFAAQAVMAQGEPPPLNVFYGEIPQADRVFFVATTGNNTDPGTEAAPWATLNYAVGQVSRGDVIVVRGGIYHHNSTISIQRNGFFDDPITLTAYPGEVPIFDFSTQPKVSNVHGIRLNASFWHVIGITLRYASHNGIRMDGSYNILEQVTSYGNHDSGIHMAGGASHNLIKNSDSFRNFNYDKNRTPNIGNNADGFSAKFESLGPGNRYYGCRAWENSDDGFDFWMAPHPIVVENSWAFGNGDPAVFDYPEDFKGNGNGFKLGGNYVHTPHTVRNNVAFDNVGSGGNAKGFDYNNNQAAMTLEHNTAFNNPRNYWFPFPAPDGVQGVFLNNLSAASPQYAVLPPNPVAAGNSWQVGTVTNDMFQSVDTNLAKGPREQDGSLPDIDLLRLAPGSFLVDGGVSFGVPFYGSAPDIGAYPYVQGDLVEPWIQVGPTAFASDVRVYDMPHGSLWEEAAFDVGVYAYPDSDAVVTSISDDVSVDGWLRTAQATGPKNYLFTTAILEFSQSTTLLVAHADAITAKPNWLSAFEPTGRQVVITQGGQERVLSIYRKDVVVGETVALGRNATTADPALPMYLVMTGFAPGVSTDELPPIAGGAELHQNFPNPVRTSTTISYTLAQPANVSIRAYDVTGRLVAELIDDHVEAGRHSFAWSADGLASGVYILRMVAGDVTEFRRIVIVR